MALAQALEDASKAIGLGQRFPHVGDEGGQTGLVGAVGLVVPRWAISCR